MTVEDFKFITQVIGPWGITAVAVVALIYFFVKTHTLGYLSEKGKQLATREDIEEITRKVEEIKSELQARRTLRFAALDKRLQAHQEAFEHCRKLLRVIHDITDLTTVTNAMTEWFDKNGLFLEKGASQAFWDAYYAAMSYNIAQGNQPRETKEMKKHWDIMVSAQKTIMEAVELPSLKLPGNKAPISEQE